MVGFFRALRASQMLTRVVGACMCSYTYHHRDSCSLPGEDHIPTADDPRPVNSNTLLRKKLRGSKRLISSHVTDISLSQPGAVGCLSYSTHNEFSEAAVSKFFHWHSYKKHIFNMPSNMQIDLFTNYTCLLIALSYTILIYISRVFLKEVIENKITSSSIFLQYLSESSCTPWNFQPGWAEDQNPWEVFFQKPPVQGPAGHSESGLLRTGPWQGYFEKVSLMIPMHTLVKTRLKNQRP